MNEYLLKIKSCGLYLNSMGGSAPVELSRVVSEGPTRYRPLGPVLNETVN